MLFFNTRMHYGLISKWMHALVGVAVLTVMTLGFLLVETQFVPGEQRGQWFTFHKGLGFIILWFALVRLILSIMQKKPAVLSQNKHNKVTLSMFFLTKWLLLALTIIMPLSGWIYVSTGGGRNFPAEAFGLHVPMIFPENTIVNDIAHSIHIFSAWLLLGLVIFHLIGALTGQFLWKDGSITRMWGKNRVK